LRGEYRAAVYVLENQLAHVNGNRAYLRTLQEAYRGYVKELRLAKQDAAAETYAKRLSILDPGSVIEQPRPAPPARPEPATPPAAVAPPDAAPKTTVRMQGAEGLPPAPAAPVRESPARALLTRADDEFGQRRYREAGRLYEQAHQADKDLAAAGRPRWAYCKL